jgi:hypothetical protein
MKKSLLLLLCLTAAGPSFAQTDTIFAQLTISDPAAISTAQNGVPIFVNPALNSILSGYHITQFRRAYPNTERPYLEKVYLLQCNSMGLPAALQAAAPALFPAWRKTGPAKPFAPFYPNDYYIYDNADLDYIRAPYAWGITQGNSNVVIGLTDTYLKEDHPDFSNIDGSSKIAHIESNMDDPAEAPEYRGHGTFVAGRLAAATHNAKGYPAIGFNCRLDFSNLDLRNSVAGNNEVLKMAQRGVRIFNGSWGYAGMYSYPLNLRDHFEGQEIYNEIYENGMFCVFAAGNGWLTGYDPKGFHVPASYDNVFSVTTIGANAAPRASEPKWNNYDVFECEKGNPVNNLQYNSSIDICAPSLSLNGLAYDPADPAKKYTDYYYSATSLGAPLVAGTAGLLQSRLKAIGKYALANYSPYQLEYILKKTAKSSVLSKTENLPYAGQLGAGALDAGEALIQAASAFDLYNPNAPATQTMYIKGVELNNVCAPGYNALPLNNPRLTPVIVNGTPPYRYVWEQVPGESTAFLDDENIAEPSITSSYPNAAGEHLFYYRLTVYDNSKLAPADIAATAQKVAMKTFRIKLKTSGYDLVLRDSYMDMGDERNSQVAVNKRDNDPYKSPDIWNRIYRDGGTEHQNAKFSVPGAINCIYTKVRNVGCDPSPEGARLRLYWTKASTGENWDVDWTTRDVAGDGGTPQPGGREIETSVSGGAGWDIPSLLPGELVVKGTNWYPPDPELYAGRPKEFDMCLLARIEESEASPFGMTFAEGFGRGVVTNVWNNNNIATRNMWLIDLRPRTPGPDYDEDEGGRPTMLRELIVANGNPTTGIFDLEFASERSVFKHFAGDFSSLGSVTLHLGDLYNIWANAGAAGTFASHNAQLKTVTFDGATTLRLEDIPLAADERYTIGVEFALDSTAVVTDTTIHTFFVRQYETSKPDEIYGGGDYEVRVIPAAGASFSRESRESALSEHESFALSPNPTNGLVTIKYAGTGNNATEMIISDMTGKKVWTENHVFTPGSSKVINLNRFASGLYIINMTDAKGRVEMYKVIRK